MRKTFRGEGKVYGLAMADAKLPASSMTVLWCRR